MTLPQEKREAMKNRPPQVRCSPEIQPESEHSLRRADLSAGKGHSPTWGVTTIMGTVVSEWHAIVWYRDPILAFLSCLLPALLL